MAPSSDSSASTSQDYWREFLTTGVDDAEKRWRRVFGRIPEDPRCKACNAPFHGFGAPIVRIFLGKRQSNMDPRYCSHCEEFLREHPGGAEIEMSMISADVRGSTALAEKLAPMAFREKINRFYKATSDVLLETDAFVDRLVGDEVVGIYVPGVAGHEHAHKAIQAAQDLLHATGHADPAGPWISVGAGVHSGVSYVGTVGSQSGAMDLTALGDVPNVAARLASMAAPGEVLVSQAACAAADLDEDVFEKRSLHLKGRVEPVSACVIKIAPP